MAAFENILEIKNRREKRLNYPPAVSFNNAMLGVGQSLPAANPGCWVLWRIRSLCQVCNAASPCVPVRFPRGSTGGWPTKFPPLWSSQSQAEGHCSCWGFRIPAASVSRGIFQNKQLLWELGGRDFGCVRLLFYKVLLFLASINRAAGVSICFYNPCCAF